MNFSNRISENVVPRNTSGEISHLLTGEKGLRGKLAEFVIVEIKRDLSCTLKRRGESLCIKTASGDCAVRKDV